VGAPAHVFAGAVLHRELVFQLLADGALILAVGQRADLAGADVG
jgi:hypothetical protein